MIENGIQKDTRKRVIKILKKIWWNSLLKPNM